MSCSWEMAWHCGLLWVCTVRLRFRCRGWGCCYVVHRPILMCRVGVLIVFVYGPSLRYSMQTVALLYRDQALYSYGLLLCYLQRKSEAKSMELLLCLCTDPALGGACRLAVLCTDLAWGVECRAVTMLWHTLFVMKRTAFVLVRNKGLVYGVRCSPFSCRRGRVVLLCGL
jgi:hypothetical protein